MPNLARPLGVKVLLLFAFWTLLGLAFGVQFHFAREQMGSSMPWSHALGYSLADWYIFALLSIPVMPLARKFPIARDQWPQALAVHFAASAFFSIAYAALRSTVAVWHSPNAISFGRAFDDLFTKSWHFNLLVYWVIVAVSLAFNYANRLRERELRAAELEKRLTEARLQALQMQLNPHFLFNTLHAISALMHQDVEAADRMLARLSDLLRRALETSDTQEVTLREEIEFLARYAEIEQTRFGERLKIEMKLPPDTLAAQVPNLVLQPLLENAIRHGIEPHARPGTITVSAWRNGGSLILEVRDNGGGLNGNWVEGVGLSNTRARLQQLYGERHEFELANITTGGVAVRVTFPFHTT